MRVMVTGARDYTDEERVWVELGRIRTERGRFTLVHGACQDKEGNLRGADLFAHEWAELHGLPIEPHPADWDTHGRAAGPIRNQEMVDTLEPGQDIVLAFPLPHSRGTRNAIKLAKDAGLEVRVREPRSDE